MSEQADIETALARATAAYKNVRAERDALKDANDRAEAAEAENEQLRAALEAIFDFIDSGEDPPGTWESICAQARATLAKEAGL